MEQYGETKGTYNSSSITTPKYNESLLLKKQVSKITNRQCQTIKDTLIMPLSKNV